MEAAAWFRALVCAGLGCGFFCWFGSGGGFGLGGATGIVAGRRGIGCWPEGCDRGVWQGAGDGLNFAGSLYGIGY